MTIIRTWPRPFGQSFAAIAGVLLLVSLSSCGSDSNPHASDLVAASLMRVSDLPRSEEWKVDTDTTDPSTKQLDKDLKECEHRTDPTAKVAKAEKDSDSFSRGDLDSAQSTAWVVHDSTRRRAFFKTLDEQLTCAGAAVSTFMQGTMSAGGSVEVTKPYVLDVQTKAGHTSGWSIEIGIVAGKDLPRQTRFLDFVVVEQGELLSGYFFLHTGDLTLKEEAAVVRRSVERVKKEHR